MNLAQPWEPGTFVIYNLDDGGWATEEIFSTIEEARAWVHKKGLGDYDCFLIYSYVESYAGSKYPEYQRKG